MTKAQQAERDAIATLRATLPPGSTVYTILRHVARSGMFRAIDCILLNEGQPHRITWAVAQTTGFTYNRRHEALGVGGCGMDMGFHVVSNLSRVLYPDGFGCVGEGCPSNDHSNGDRDYTLHRNFDPTRTEPNSLFGYRHWHTAGDYALRHRWL